MSVLYCLFHAILYIQYCTVPLLLKYSLWPPLLEFCWKAQIISKANWIYMIDYLPKFKHNWYNSFCLLTFIDMQSIQDMYNNHHHHSSLDEKVHVSNPYNRTDLIHGSLVTNRFLLMKSLIPVAIFRALELILTLQSCTNMYNALCI